MASRKSNFHIVKDDDGLLGSLDELIAVCPEREHEDSADCWCKPENLGDGVYVHEDRDC